MAKKTINPSLVICKKCGAIMAEAMDGVYNCNECHAKGVKKKK